MNAGEFFGGKRVTLMGLGVLGRGIGDAEFLAQSGAEVTVTDTKSETELVDSMARLAMYSNIRFHLGGHQKEDFSDADMVIKAAGVPLDSPFIQIARESGVPVYMSTALLAKHAQEVGAQVIGVTGTRGKSTISYMIHHALAHAGRRSHFGGNIRGVSTLAFMGSVLQGDIVVLELDSWQLQGFGDLMISPHIAVFSTFMRDHLNYYPDLDTYFADKANIFRNQKPGDHLFVGPGVEERIEAAHPPVAAVVPAPVPADWKLHIIGEHNKENAALAAAALFAAGLTVDDVRSGLESFVGVEGRLQYLGEKRGIAIYNDNNATTPEATIVALRAIGGNPPSPEASGGRGKNVVLIAGGSDKGLELGELAEAVNANCTRALLLAGSGTDKLKIVLPNADVFATLREALTAALQTASAGDTILFSPGFASFGMFKNEYDRNDQFLSLVKKI